MASLIRYGSGTCEVNAEEQTCFGQHFLLVAGFLNLWGTPGPQNMVAGGSFIKHGASH